MNGVPAHEQDCPEFVEFDPTGRYGRYSEILGKGASKTVYRAFDEYEGIEVAWNQVKLHDFLQRPEDLERLYSEIHLLQTLKHTNIMKFYTSWVDTANRNINFVTEMFTSGTLRQYRLKHKRINIRAVKNWCRQILKGLVYLHSHDPPVIHRDLKCDNIFINGNQGEVKIGDLGLAAILCKSHAVRCVGTPEFMAPEVYAEEYNELVDIYSFGMCILEMVTSEYPYSECTHPAQIYKKVVSGKKPNALYKVRDPEVRQFVEKCLAPASCRLPATELLKDHFLQIDDYGYNLRAIEYSRDFDPLLRQPLLRNHHSSSNSSWINGYSSNYLSYETWNDLDYSPEDFELNEIDLPLEQHMANVDITINGSWTEDDGIFLRLRIADKEGHVRNIYFHFDIKTDTALSVATEMVAELDMTDQEVTKIADMIDTEITALVPNWKMGLRRFEEITDQLEGSEQCVTEGTLAASSSQSDGIQYDELCSEESLRDIHSDDELEEQSSLEKGERDVNKYQKMTRKELSWFKRKHQMQQTELRDQQLETVGSSSSLALGSDNGFPLSSFSTPLMESCSKDLLKCLASNTEKKCANQRAWNCKAPYGSCHSSEQVTTANGFHTGALVPHSLLKTTSLPVDF